MASYFRAIDAMAAFPNVLGAFVAYDLISNTHSLECTPVVAAVVRDLKRYMAIKKRSTGQRVLPIGYGVGDTSIGVDTTVMKYLLSQAPTDRIDFYAVRGVSSPQKVLLPQWRCLTPNWPDSLNASQPWTSPAWTRAVWRNWYVYSLRPSHSVYIPADLANS